MIEYQRNGHIPIASHVGIKSKSCDLYLRYFTKDLERRNPAGQARKAWEMTNNAAMRRYELWVSSGSEETFEVDTYLGILK